MNAMKTVSEHIEYVKGKPHHIRKQIAFGVSSGIAALIALVWLITSVGSGAFALKGSTFSDDLGLVPEPDSDALFGNQNLAGAAAALQDESVPAHIEIIDAPSAAAETKRVEQTTVPF